MIGENRKIGFNTSFRSLWFGQSMANLGDVLYIVAIVAIIYNSTNSPASAALVPFTSSVAQLASGLVAPMVLDRFGLRKILLLCQGLKTFVLLTLYFMLSTGLSLPVILSFIFLISFIDGWTTPARQALIPALVMKQELSKANALLSSTDQAVFLLGWSAGGVSVASLGSYVTLGITILLFSLSTVSILKVKIRDKENLEMETSTSLAERMKEGWSEIWHKRALRTTTCMDIVETLANGVWTGALMLVFAREFLGRDESFWGFMNTSYYIGTISGGLLAVWASKWLNANLGKAIVIGGLSMSFFTFLFSQIPVPWVALLLCITMGPAYSIRDIAQITIFQTVTDERRMAKAYAARNTIVYSLFGLSVLAMGAVAESYGVSAAYLLAAILYFLSAAIGLFARSLFQVKNPA
ncbi:MFS transporter [Pseudalkalibacillus caeni]|uniref:MFS transporter n=1 Tax=Exobacillus caeni TaxID=2574798 RepID=A0A5R9EVW8_9BACL|nr:MFS transporter [Pseudalkalibacillus caeni]TLS34951.1 MFS transporter [Pseudalkalibacillus caeni]